MLLLAVTAIAIGSVGIYTVFAQGEDPTLNQEKDGSMPMLRFGTGRKIGYLNEEQRKELATDIQALIESKMEKLGIERPEPLLTEEQRTEIKTIIYEMRTANATVEEIREAVKEKTIEWGIELPEMPLRDQCSGKFFRRKQRTKIPVITDEA